MFTLGMRQVTLLSVIEGLVGILKVDMWGDPEEALFVPPFPSLSRTSNNTQNIIYALFRHCLHVIWCIFVFIFSAKLTCLKCK